MTAHTPGPWEFVQVDGEAGVWGEHDIYAGSQDDALYIARTNGGTGADIANAAVLSAAPELLAACKAYREAFAAIRRMTGWSEGECDLWLAPTMLGADDIATAAIAKAEGRA